MRRVHDAQGQIVLTLDGSLPPGASGPPLRVHFHEHEEGIVKAGTLGAQVGTKKIIVPVGGTAVLPAGLPHRWWNAGDTLLEFSGQVAPAVDLDRYLQAVFAVLNASSNGRPSIFHLAHVLWRHRGTQLFRFRPKPFSGSSCLSFCLSGACWANTADRAGPVRPSRALVRRLWKPAPLSLIAHSDATFQ
jgi:quercetin dioxygenase-like cupin family protein